MKKEVWRLYAAATRRDTMKVALDEAYAKASGTHVLIYKQGKCPAGFKEIKEANIDLLPAADKEWLREVNIEVTRKFLAEHDKEVQKAGEKFLERFGQELSNEREKLANQGSGAE